eukprot:1709027-Ditylum_brightwellii.AAC.1
MGQVDCFLYVQSTITNEEWNETKAIPTRAPFTKALGFKQVSNGHGPTQVTAVMAIISTLQLNTIKFYGEVWNYLKKQTVYIHPDRFLRNKVVSPGTIVDIHPDLVRKNDLEAELKKKLAQQPISNTNVCAKWIQQHAPHHDDTKHTPVPDFTIKSLDINWGGIGITALKILYAEKDGLYLKLLLSHAWTPVDCCGKF